MSDHPTQLDEETIRQRAYELWEQAGRPDGRHDEFWRQARTELMQDQASQADKAA